MEVSNQGYLSLKDACNIYRHSYQIDIEPTFTVYNDLPFPVSCGFYFQSKCQVEGFIEPNQLQEFYIGNSEGRISFSLSVGKKESKEILVYDLMNPSLLYQDQYLELVDHGISFCFIRNV